MYIVRQEKIYTSIIIVNQITYSLYRTQPGGGNKRPGWELKPNKTAG